MAREKNDALMDIEYDSEGDEELTEPIPTQHAVSRQQNRQAASTSQPGAYNDAQGRLNVIPHTPS